MRRFIYIFSMFFLIVFGFAACGDSESKEVNENNHNQANDQNEETDEGNNESKENDTDESEKEVTPDSLLEWDTSDFEDSAHETVQFDDIAVPEGASTNFASNGIFILDGDDHSEFYDYENGEESDFDFNDKGDPWQRHDMHTFTYVFDDYFYAINDEDEDSDELEIVEIDIDSGEKNILTSVDSIPFLAKSENVLFVEDDEELFAYDTEKEEKIWEKDIEVDYTFFDMEATDNAIVLSGDEGLAVYSQSDGEKTYDTEGVFLGIGVDGEDFYAAEESDDTLTDMEKSNIQVQRFNESDENPEELFTTPAVNTPVEEDDLKVDIDDERIYIKSPLGISSYNKNGDNEWHVAIGEELFQEVDVDEGSLHDNFETEYLNGNVYVQTNDEIDGEETNLLTVIDGKTGEMKENYSFEEGSAFGPAVDDDRVIVFHLPEIDDRRMYIISDDEIK